MDLPPFSRLLMEMNFFQALVEFLESLELVEKLAEEEERLGW